MSKSAKRIAELISQLMQDNKLTRSDIGRGLVVLDNLEQEYIWKGGIKHVKDKPEKTIKLKEKKGIVLEECTS